MEEFENRLTNQNELVRVFFFFYISVVLCNNIPIRFLTYGSLRKFVIIVLGTSTQA